MSTYFGDLLTVVADLARLLRRKPQGVARDAFFRSETLPPFIRPGKTPLWPRHAVEEWLHQNKSGEFPQGFRFFMPTHHQSQSQQPTLAEMMLAVANEKGRALKSSRGTK